MSAGFDAHRDDPLANLALSSGDFARLASVEIAQSLAGVEHLVSVVEGTLRDDVTITELLEATGGALGVREDHRHGPRRLLACHARILCLSGAHGNATSR